MVDKAYSSRGNAFDEAQRLEREIARISKREGARGAKKKAASKLKIKPSMASKYLSILKYDDETQAIFKEGFLGVYHVQFLNKVPRERQYDLAQALRSGLSVSEVDSFIERVGKPVIEQLKSPPQSSKPTLEKDVDNLLERYEQVFGVSFKVRDVVPEESWEMVVSGFDTKLLREMLVVPGIISEGLEFNIQTFSNDPDRKLFEIRFPYSVDTIKDHLGAVIQSFRLVEKLRAQRGG